MGGDSQPTRSVRSANGTPLSKATSVEHASRAILPLSALLGCVATRSSLCNMTPIGYKAGAVVEGYEFDFPAEVHAGKLRGRRGDAGQASLLTLVATIGPDGEAVLTADGFTGKPDYTFGQMQAASPYRYMMRGRFDARSKWPFRESGASTVRCGICAPRLN